MFGDGSLTFQEFIMREPHPLAVIHDAVLAFLRDRKDAVLYGAHPLEVLLAHRVVQSVLRLQLVTQGGIARTIRLGKNQVHHVGRIGTRTRGLLALDEVQRAAAQPVSDAVGVLGDLPLGVHKGLQRAVGEPVGAQPDHGANLDDTAERQRDDGGSRSGSGRGETQRNAVAFGDVNGVCCAFREPRLAAEGFLGVQRGVFGGSVAFVAPDDAGLAR